jgi:hypothetical protein
VSLAVLDLRAEALLLCFAALAAIFLMVGCTGGRSQADQESRAPRGAITSSSLCFPSTTPG